MLMEIGGVQVDIDPAYEWWMRRLAGEVVEVHDGHAHAGFYRKKGKGTKPWLPVGIWWDGERDENGDLTEDATLICQVGPKHSATIEDPAELWSYVCDQPVTEEAYRDAFETGNWPDDAPRPRGVIGDNLPDDPLSAVNSELEGEAEIVAQFLSKPVETQGDADKVGPWAKRLLSLQQRADHLRETEKRPHLTACREIDDKWRLPIARAKEMVDTIRAHIQPFLLKQKAEEERLARQAAAEAARLRGQAEAERQSEAKRTELLRQATEQEAKAKPRKVAAGRTGAKVVLRTEKRAQITDYDALFAALKDRSEMRELVDTLAQRSARAGSELPGMKIIEIEKAA